MAHNLANIGGRYAMAYQGATPWHQLGQKLGRLTDVDAALDAAGLRYTVQLEPIYLADGRKVDGRQAALRLTGDSSPAVQLGTVGDAYTVVQNVDAAAIMRPLVDMGATIDAAGALGNGEKVWLLANMGQTITPVAGDDVRGYFLLHWSHNGETGVIGSCTGIRVVCQNTLDMAAASAKSVAVALRHTTNVGARVDQAAALMKRFSQALKETGDTFAQMARKGLTAAQVAAYIETVIPADGAIVSPVVRSRRDTIAKLVFGGRGADVANGEMAPGVASAWAAYNAVTEYFDHVRPAEAKSAAGVARANSSAVFGGNAAIKASALVVARQLVAA